MICDICNGPCESGYEIRTHGTDESTGYQDTETVCSWCATPTPCEFCRARNAVVEVTRDGELYAACESCRTLSASPDILEIAKAHMESHV